MAEPKKHKAQVLVNREGYDGWFQGGKYYANGQQEAELTDEEALALARRPGVMVLIGGKQVAKTPDTGGTGIQVSVSEDEYAELQRIRAEKQKQQSQAAPPPTQKLEFEGRVSAGAASQQLLDNPGPGASGAGRHEPLQDTAVLHGEPPPENLSSATGVKPLEPSPGKKK